MDAFGLYIHIPFCRQKCFYCDFPSYAGMEALQAAYVDALRTEIRRRGAFLARRGAMVDTVYIGGGTPTVLPGRALADLLTAVQKAFAVSPAAEITVEANPGTADAAKLAALREAGANRISFGVQSLEDELLWRIGRMHTAAQAEAAVRRARQEGLQNIGVDLMYGLPGQRLAHLADSVRGVLSFAVMHISVYGLQVEEGTPFAAALAENRLNLPDEAETDAMYSHLTRVLPEAGYARYEISNFARSGFESRHNLRYWQNRPYLGLGAAAHSYVEPERFANTADVRQYIDYIKEGKDPASPTEHLDRRALMEEYCFLALRTRAGIACRAFEEKFSCNISSVYGHIIEELCEKQLLRCADDRVFLTELGMRYGNRVFCAFLLK